MHSNGIVGVKANGFQAGDRVTQKGGESAFEVLTAVSKEGNKVALKSLTGSLAFVELAENLVLA
ncbi:MAG: hypothetical protein K8Q91_03050 [Candidatus Vogelbacteria bacterium]|nr:hypothetical protein [Candidatus Vogelbacteria bacterium]